MPRRSLENFRRDQLSHAAFETLAAHGLKATSLARVAENAGLSKGIVLHYFGSKAALMEAAIRRSNAVLRDEVIALLRHAQTPWERLYAIAEGNFSAKVFKPSLCHAWLAMCAEVPYNPRFQRIQTIIHSRMRSNLMPNLSPLVPAADREQVALAITAAIDGIWLEGGLKSGGLDRESALGRMEFLFNHLIPTSGGALEERSAARRRIRSVYEILASAA